MRKCICFDIMIVQKLKDGHKKSKRDKKDQKNQRRRNNFKLIIEYRKAIPFCIMYFEFTLSYPISILF